MRRFFANLSASIVILVAAVLTARPPLHAQIATDGTTGPAQRLQGPSFQIPDTLGTRRGGNLFHSFDQFNIRTLPNGTVQSATFTGPAGVSNVISRVTGDNRSSINGPLASTIPNADFFFLNPNGVTFGPNASLDVPGSFHVSTADELQFANGATISATAPENGSLTIASPEAFGFLGPGAGGITVDNSVLAVGEGEALSLVGGPLRIIGGPEGQIAAPSGRISLAAIEGAGTATVTAGDVLADALDDVTLSDRALLDVSGDGGGAVRVRAGRFVLSGTSNVFADNTGSANAAGGIDIESQILAIRSDSQVTTDAVGSGDAGRLTIATGRLSMEDGALISSSTFGGSSGDAGDISVRASDLDIRSGSAIASVTRGAGDSGAITILSDRVGIFDNLGSFTGITSTVEPGASGDAGSITIETRNLEIGNGGLIATGTFGTGRAGTLNVDAERISIYGTRRSFVTGLSSSAREGSAGSAGGVTVIAQDLEIRGGGIISSRTFGSGNGGTVAVDAERVEIVGGRGVLTGISSDTQGGAFGEAGDVLVRAEDLDLRDGGLITSGTFGPGNAGAVSVEAENLRILGGDRRLATGISSSALQSSAGNAGSVEVTARNLEIREGGTIQSSTRGTGDGGFVQVDSQHLFVSADDSRFVTGIASRSEGEFSGRAGDIVVNARDMAIQSGGSISSDTFTRGDAGSVEVSASRLLIVGSAGTFTGISSDADPGSSGAAGDVIVSATELSLNHEALIASRGLGFGPGGNAIVRVGDTLRGIGGRITAETAFANAGNIVIRGGRVIQLSDSSVTTSAAGGFGGGGSVDIGSRFVVLNRSQIVARAREGVGGNIDIVAQNVVQTPDSEIDASSLLGVDGNVNITASSDDVTQSIDTLSAAFLDVSGLLADDCATRAAEDGQSGTLTGSGSSGVRPDPDAPLAGSYVDRGPIGEPIPSRWPLPIALCGNSK